MRSLKEIAGDIDRARKEIEALEAVQPARKWKNRRYVFDFAFPAVATPLTLLAGSAPSSRIRSRASR